VRKQATDERRARDKTAPGGGIGVGSEVHLRLLAGLGSLGKVAARQGRA